MANIDPRVDVITVWHAGNGAYTPVVKFSAFSSKQSLNLIWNQLPEPNCLFHMLFMENNASLPAGNNEDAFYSIMTLYYNDLFRYCIRFTADVEDSKDLVNQFFLQSWEHREKFLAAENRKAYLVVSFKRYLINHLRKSFPFKSLVDYPDEPMEHSYEDHIICLEESEAVRFALQRSLRSLPSRQKELVILRFYENMSYEAIALKSSLTIRTVYNKIHLALKTLRSIELVQQIRKNNGPLSSHNEP